MANRRPTSNRIKLAQMDSGHDPYPPIKEIIRKREVRMTQKIRTQAEASREVRRRWGPHAHASMMPKRHHDRFRVYRVSCGMMCNKHLGFGRSWDAAFIAAEHSEWLFGEREKRITRERNKK